MFKQVLFVLSISTLLSAFTLHYDVYMDFKTGYGPKGVETSFVINGEKVKCRCGADPKYILFCYGSPEAYCHKCLPIKADDTVDCLDIKLAEAKSEGNYNGAHQS